MINDSKTLVNVSKMASVYYRLLSEADFFNDLRQIQIRNSGVVSPLFQNVSHALLLLGAGREPPVETASVAWVGRSKINSTDFSFCKEIALRAIPSATASPKCIRFREDNAGRMLNLSTAAFG